jgi:CTP:molybdopterin cytidylyltransferase MocA
VTVAGLLLAAGSGRRFGSPKALVQLEGQLLVERGVELLRFGGCQPVIVVVGARADAVRRHVDDRAAVAVAADWAEGVGASLRVGLAEASRTSADACIVALVDQPLVDPRAVRALIQAPGPAAVATYVGEPGHPVMLRRAIWSDVAQMAVADAGARYWLRAHRATVTQVPCDGLGSPRDIDTVEDLALVVSLLCEHQDSERHLVPEVARRNPRG